MGQHWDVYLGVQTQGKNKGTLGNESGTLRQSEKCLGLFIEKNGPLTYKGTSCHQTVCQDQVLVSPASLLAYLKHF